MLIACSNTAPYALPKGHLSSEPAQQTRPQVPHNSPATRTPSAENRENIPSPETYSVIVNNVAVHDLLFALARDAKINIDIHPGITGLVTLNAIDQTLPQLLARITKQVDMRFEMEGKNLAIMPDTPFLRHYGVDYVNISRNMTGTIAANSQITSGLPGSASTSSSSGNSAGNVSNTRIENTSKNQFWETLEQNIKDILRETDKIFPEGSSETLIEQSSNQSATGLAALTHSSGKRTAQNGQLLQPIPTANASAQASGNATLRRSTFREAASVIMNAESGVIAVRATQRQHDRIHEFIEQVANSARRQVLIETTIAEVTLKNGYEQGIDWTQLGGKGLIEYLGNPLKSTVNMRYTRDQNPNALISLLETFGTTKVLSSPRLSVLNNQTALLKVVENYVYFTVKADTTSTANVGTSITYTTTPQTVSVGLVMGVTPQISANDMVTLNIRPTITSVGREIADPNPDLRKNGIENLVPMIRTREVESVMRIASGDIAILGGLMEDRIDYQTQRVPLLGQIPIAGELLNNRNNLSQKSELVIFLRPIIVKDADINGDYRNLREMLPEKNFFRQPDEARPLSFLPNH
ncbi:type II secretion system protein GspD [Quatrionicoccus australiensis]|uniref:type II secretion system protein GspD n=1 Tax=Quatrionicoccus australiensis TaxID=138118 RepID=UPI001CF9C5F7|nr:secretin N-terminal domain-containing protein [Quatrionicoccus australiensis]